MPRKLKHTAYDDYLDDDDGYSETDASVYDAHQHTEKNKAAKGRIPHKPSGNKENKTQRSQGNEHHCSTSIQSTSRKIIDTSHSGKEARVVLSRPKKENASACTSSTTAEATYPQGNTIDCPDILTITPVSKGMTNKSRELGGTKDDAEPLNIVVIGHVDSGKSTLMGQLFYELGAVSEQQMNKLKKICMDFNKPFDAYAWIFDEGEEERERCITVDVCAKTFKTLTRRVTVFDAPGHQELLGHMLQAAAFADAAVVVIHVNPSSSYCLKKTHTYEHIQLLWHMGIKSFIIAINKLDRVQWKESVYKETLQHIQEELLKLGIGATPPTPIYVPLSALHRTNVVKPPSLKDNPCVQWMIQQHVPSLLEAINSVQLLSPVYDDREDEDALIVCLMDTWGSESNATACGKVYCGRLHVGDEVTVVPTGIVAKIVDLQDENGKSFCVAKKGYFVDAIRLSLEEGKVAPGFMLCHGVKSVSLVTSLTAVVTIFNSNNAILPGFTVMLYLHLNQQQATITSLDLLVSRNHSPLKRISPPYLIQDDKAIITLKVNTLMYVEYHRMDRPLLSATVFSRLILRYRDMTIAAGVVVAPNTRDI